MIRSAEEFVALRTSTDPREYNRAAHEAAEDEVWFGVIDRFPEMRQWVARNKTTSSAVLQRLAGDTEASVRHSVAMVNRIDVALLRRLASDPDESVRAQVAGHKKSPADLLELLRDDSSWVVREVAEARLAHPS